MPQVQVWAPKLDELSVVLSPSGERIPMERDEQGVFTSQAELVTGQRYFLSLPNGLNVPDPRSRRQPEGIHGPSEMIDPSSFEWHDQDWKGFKTRGKLHYELHIGTFTPEGTFRAAIDRLDYLVELGVEVVELMPINPIPGKRGWGYDCVSLMATYEEYGSPEDLVALVDAMHARGLAACLDVVYNHFGPDGNYVGLFADYLTDAHRTPWGDALNLDGEGSVHVRRFILDAITGWARDYHFDAFRMDAVDRLVDTTSPHILAEVTDALHTLGEELGHPISVVMESDANSVTMTEPTPHFGGETGSFGADMQWVDDVHHALHVWLTEESNAYYSEYVDEAAVEKVMRQGYYHDGVWTNFDSKIRGTAVPDTLDGHRFVVFDENHDQVGNRLVGDRPSSKLSLGELALSRALILLSPYTPMLFMGEEWATRRPFPFFTDHDAQIGDGMVDARASEFANWNLEQIYGEQIPQVPDPQALETFESAKLDWSETQQPEHQKFLAFVRELVKLRASVPSFASGDRTQSEFHLTDDRMSGWMRRGYAFVVFTQDRSGASVTVPGFEGAKLLLSFEPVECDGASVTFSSAGVAVFA